MPIGRLDRYSIRTLGVEVSPRFCTGIHPAAEAAAR
jgi:hypothetical protein